MCTGCSEGTDINDTPYPEEAVVFKLSLNPFEGELSSRTTYDGLGFEGNEQFRMEIICPHSGHHENGEPWSSSYHTISLSDTRYSSKEGDSWVYGTVSSYEAQATTYIYTAQNTTATRVFVIGDDRYTRPSNFFYADQSKLDQFKKSDVVWAQAIRQTGAREVHLNFKHKVAKLDITIDDSNVSSTMTANSILTLEGMPDIDGAEIVVGDYYADDSYVDYDYNYRQKASCSFENNGKVIGIEVIDEDAKRSKIWPMSGNPANPGGTNSLVFNPNGSATPVPNTGVYTAYHDPGNVKHYVLYVPECDLAPNNATVWIREGKYRYSAKLDRTQFEAGHCYYFNLKLGEFTPSKADWTATATSISSDEHSAQYAVDGENNTYWQSNAEGSLPQELVIDMKKTYKLSGLTYRPRQDEEATQETGLIKDYELYYKENESDEWHIYFFDKFQYNDADRKAEINVNLYSHVWARYIKLVAKSEISGQAQVSVGEIGIKAVGVK